MFGDRWPSCEGDLFWRAGRLSSLGGLGAVVRAPAVEHRKGWFWVVAVAAIILVAVSTAAEVERSPLIQQRGFGLNSQPPVHA